MDFIIHNNNGKAYRFFGSGAPAERLPAADRTPVRKKIYQLPPQAPQALKRGTYLSSLSVYMDDEVIQSRKKPLEILHLTRLSDFENHAVIRADMSKYQIDWVTPRLKPLGDVSILIRTGGGKLVFSMAKNGETPAVCSKRVAMKVLKEYSHPQCFTHFYRGLIFKYPPNFDELMKEIQQYPGLLSVQDDEVPLAQVLTSVKDNPIFDIDLRKARPYRESLYLDEADFDRILKTAKEAVSLNAQDRDVFYRRIMLDVLKCHDPNAFPMTVEEAVQLVPDYSLPKLLKEVYRNGLQVGAVMEYLNKKVKDGSPVDCRILVSYLERTADSGSSVSSLPDDLKSVWEKQDEEIHRKTMEELRKGCILFGG